MAEDGHVRAVKKAGIVVIRCGLGGAYYRGQAKLVLSALARLFTRYGHCPAIAAAVLFGKMEISAMAKHRRIRGRP